MTEITESTVVIPGTRRTSPEWLAAAADLLAERYTLRYHEAHEGYVAMLTDTRAALILVDGARDDWRYWTATPKSSPATRRIPVFLIADDPNVQAQALQAGADLALAPEELLRSTLRLADDYARVPDSARMEQLDCQCQEPLPELARQGVEKFNSGEYYKQHDLFEELWMETDGPVRDLYRAVLQVGVAYYQILRGNHRGATKMLMRSVQWLAILPDQCQGIDVAALREDSYRVRAALAALPEDQIDSFDTSLIQPVKMVDEPAE